MTSSTQDVRILTVVGARPQFIKASAFSHVVANADGVDEVLVHTGQHYDERMSSYFFDELGIPAPDYRLETGGKSHAQMTGEQLISLENIMLEVRPDLVLVYGDTNSTLAGAVAASKLNIPIAHVEAGLRSRNRSMPEEVNRILTDHVSDWLFAPTDTAVENLSTEGLSDRRVSKVGDIMYDVCLKVKSVLPASPPILKQFGLLDASYAVVTIHRAETTTDPSALSGIVEALCALAQTMKVVFPVHPRTNNALEQIGLRSKLSDVVELIEPVGFVDMSALLRSASLVVTDSGGLQKEAYFYRIPTVTLRTETEWVELLDAGWNRLPVSLDARDIGDSFRAAIGSLGREEELFGDGTAATQILTELLA